MSIAFETPTRRAPPSQAARGIRAGSLQRIAQALIVAAAYAFVTTVLIVL